MQRVIGTHDWWSEGGGIWESISVIVTWKADLTSSDLWELAIDAYSGY